KGFFLDLGGQISERKSIAKADENVFDIEQGVTVGVVLTVPGKGRIQFVTNGRITGTREDKHRVLSQSSIVDLTSTISMAPPLYRFTRSVDGSDIEFETWPTLDQVMPFN